MTKWSFFDIPTKSREVWWWLTCRHHAFSEGGGGASNFAGRACNTCGAPAFFVER